MTEPILLSLSLSWRACHLFIHLSSGDFSLELLFGELAHNNTLVRGEDLAGLMGRRKQRVTVNYRRARGQVERSVRVCKREVLTNQFHPMPTAVLRFLLVCAACVYVRPA